MATLQDIFHKFDLVKTGAMDLSEFNVFLHAIGKPQLKDQQEYSTQITSKFNSTLDKSALTLKGFREWWKS